MTKTNKQPKTKPTKIHTKMQIGDAEGMPGNNPSVQNGYGI